MIKLIAMDLDGTFLYPKSRIFGVNKGNRVFLRQLKEMGIDVIFVSGRSVKILKYLDRINGLDNKLLGCNGSFLYQGGKLIEKHPMDRAYLTKLILKIVSRYGIFAYFLFDEHKPLYLFFENLPNSFIASLWIGNKFNGAYKEDIVFGKDYFFDKMQNTDNYKLMLSFGFGDGARERAKEAYLSIKDIYPDMFSTVISSTALEITAKGVDKGVGLMEYCRENNIRPEEVIVAGDSGNDIAMYDCFAHSFAMEHAPDYVKKQANHIVRRVSDIMPYLLDQTKIQGDKIKERLDMSTIF